MSRRAPGPNQRKENVGHHKQKYRPGLDPLEQEANLGDMVPLGTVERARMLAIVDQLLTGQRLQKQEEKALRMWKMNLNLEGVKGEVHQAFVRDFWGWLLGRGQEADHVKTPWYRQSLADDPEVTTYVDMFVHKMSEFKVKIELLRIRRPIGINQCFIYYKYIIRGEPATSTNFLDDWQLFLDEYWEAGGLPDPQEWRDDRDTDLDFRKRGMPMPHEVRPYGYKRKSLSQRRNKKFDEGTPQKILGSPSPASGGRDQGGDGDEDNDDPDIDDHPYADSEDGNLFNTPPGRRPPGGQGRQRGRSRRRNIYEEGDLDEAGLQDASDSMNAVASQIAELTKTLAKQKQIVNDRASIPLPVPASGPDREAIDKLEDIEGELAQARLAAEAARTRRDQIDAALEANRAQRDAVMNKTLQDLTTAINGLAQRQGQPITVNVEAAPTSMDVDMDVAVANVGTVNQIVDNRINEILDNFKNGIPTPQQTAELTNMIGSLNVTLAELKKGFETKQDITISSVAFDTAVKENLAKITKIFLDNSQNQTEFLKTLKTMQDDDSARFRGIYSDSLKTQKEQLTDLFNKAKTGTKVSDEDLAKMSGAVLKDLVGKLPTKEIGDLTAATTGLLNAVNTQSAGIAKLIEEQKKPSPFPIVQDQMPDWAKRAKDLEDQLAKTNGELQAQAALLGQMRKREIDLENALRVMRQGGAEWEGEIAKAEAEKKGLAAALRGKEQEIAAILKKADEQRQRYEAENARLRQEVNEAKRQGRKDNSKALKGVGKAIGGVQIIIDREIPRKPQRFTTPTVTPVRPVGQYGQLGEYMPAPGELQPAPKDQPIAEPGKLDRDYDGRDMADVINNLKEPAYDPTVAGLGREIAASEAQYDIDVSDAAKRARKAAALDQELKDKRRARRAALEEQAPPQKPGDDKPAPGPEEKDDKGKGEASEPWFTAKKGDDEDPALAELRKKQEQQYQDEKAKAKLDAGMDAATRARQQEMRAHRRAMIAQYEAEQQEILQGTADQLSAEKNAHLAEMRAYEKELDELERLISDLSNANTSGTKKEQNRIKDAIHEQVKMFFDGDMKKAQDMHNMRLQLKELGDWNKLKDALSRTRKASQKTKAGTTPAMTPVSSKPDVYSAKAAAQQRQKVTQGFKSELPQLKDRTFKSEEEKEDAEFLVVAQLKREKGQGTKQKPATADDMEMVEGSKNNPPPKSMIDEAELARSLLGEAKTLQSALQIAKEFVSSNAYRLEGVITEERYNRIMQDRSNMQDVEDVKEFLEDMQSKLAQKEQVVIPDAPKRKKAQEA